jgi:hypothetical protein
LMMMLTNKNNNILAPKIPDPGTPELGPPRRRKIPSYGKHEILLEQGGEF